MIDTNDSVLILSPQNNITPLHVASRWGKSNMVQLLLDNKATIDEKTRVSTCIAAYRPSVGVFVPENDQNCQTVPESCFSITCPG